ncbi:MAG: hypothetical protein KGM47_15150, partial [Acidobacteriota bacterium]|nr:hypothetical protein [Acidobacteriota bacterium]
MDRRGFVRNALAGIAGISGVSRASKDDFAAALIGKPGAAGDAAAGSVAEVHGDKLFPTDVAAGKWLRMEAAEFTAPVCAVVYRRENEVRNGMPLGGVSTGFIDVETDGTWGQGSIFNSGVPVREKTGLPFLGINVDGRTWVLSTRETLGTGNSSEIYYWGHYPVVDMEFETTAPVSVGLRAWSPFVPGNVLDSNIPGAVFEVHLRNTSSKTQEGAVALTFPGPTEAEAQIGPTSVRAKRFIDWFPVHDAVAEGPVEMRRQNFSDAGFHGQIITSEKGNGYALGVIGEETARFGGPLGRAGYDFASGQQWAAIHRRLPFTPAAEPGASVAVNFALRPGESKTIRLLLAWYSPVWKGEGDHYFARMCAKHYQNAAAVAKALARDHQSLLKRVLAWQQAVYVSEDLPVWLRESLVNILHLTTKTGYWAQAEPPIGGWCKEEDGLWGMNECPRDCPQIECIPCSFYGNVPVVYFFPELALSTLRGYKAYQYTDGAAPWVFGGCTSGAAVGYRATDGAEMAIPSPGYQTTLNGPCYVDMFDRYWQRTGNDEVVKEFYDSLKKNTTYTMNLRPGPEGIVSVPAGNVNPTNPKGTPGSGLDWFEGNKWFGMTPHVGGIHLAQLRMMERIAKKVGDEEYAAQCAKWREQGSKEMEEKLWAGKYYLSYYEPESGKKSEL